MPWAPADDQWYVDHVLPLLEPGWIGPIGEARRHELGWLRAIDEAEERSKAVPAAASAFALASRQGFVLTTRQVRRIGVTCAMERRFVRQGLWGRPRSGVVCVVADRSSSHEMIATAAALLHPGALVSHTSAALLWGLPILGRIERPILTRRHRSDAGGRADVLLHSCRCHPDEVEQWHGVLVTSVARTVIDTARAHGTAAGLVVADAALRKGLVTSATLTRSVELARGRPGVVAARRVVELADPRAESPLESITRLCLVEAGFGLEPQWWIELTSGRARVDLALVAEGVVIEADGALKYPDRDEGRRVLWKEKQRHESLNRVGWEVVRVTWDEVMHDPGGVIARVHAAVARQRRLRASDRTVGVR